MYISPEHYEKKKGRFYLDGTVTALAHPSLDNDSIKEFFFEFALRRAKLQIKLCEEYTFVVGNASGLPCGERGYSVNVTQSGIAVMADNERLLKTGMMALLDMIEADETGVFIPACTASDSSKIKNRMVHVCVFPETPLSFLQKTVRACAFMRYTHVIIEFWGMLKFDCMKELSWANAYTKAEIASVVSEAKDLGIELVPMLNHLGHASQSRLCFGKHVVLDQDPSLWSLFESDGWAWNILDPHVPSLMKQVRDELCTLFPDSEYFHIGCDEVYSYGNDIKKAKNLTEYINSVAADLEKSGRKAIMWGDMLWKKGSFNGDGNIYEFNIESEEIASLIRNGLSKNILIADWQYAAKKAPVRSAAELIKLGFSTLVCPFLDNDNLDACVQTVSDLRLDGIIYTTWHLINERFWMLLHGAQMCAGTEALSSVQAMAGTASILRKVSPANGNYCEAGWAKNQI